MEPEHGMKAIEDIVAQTFVKVHQDLETILSSTEIPSAAAASDELLPALQLGHGRTYSESDEYINVPFSNLPEVVVDVANSRTAAEAAATEAATESLLVQQVLKHAINDSNTEGSYGEAQPGRPESFSEPTASGTCTALDNSMPSPPGVPAVPSGLRYEELLDRAIAGMDPKLQQMSNNLLHRSDSKTALDRQRSSSVRRSSNGGNNSGGGSTAARPNSRGRPPAPQGRAEAVCRHSWQPQSKFPASSNTNNRGTAGSPAGGDGSKSLRIFKQGSGAAMQLLGELQDKPIIPAAAGQKGSHRSSSAPREISSVERHVQRMSRSPVRRGSSGGLSGAAPERQAKSSPSQTLSYIERLYAVGREKQFKRMHPPQQRSVSPDSAHLSEQDWNRVTTRLYNDARKKEERMRVRREHAAEEVMTAAGGRSVSDRLRSIDAQQANSNGRRSGGGAPSADFYRRQEAAWKRREERIEAGKRRPSIDEEDEKECTFKPEISAASKQLCPHRSVDELFKWEDHKRIHVWQLYEGKAELELDPKKYTWAPKIGERSRRLALQRYAASPDDRLPWTKCPRHTSAPPKQTSPPRQPSPPPRSIYSASFSVSHGIQAEPDYSYASPEQLRHSIAGPLMHCGSPASAGGGYAQDRQAPASEPTAATTSRALLGQSVDSAPKQLAFAEGSAGQSNFMVWEGKLQCLQKNPFLPSGVVMGIPVYDGPAAVAPAAPPVGAVSIQMQQLRGSPATKELAPVAPGDGVAFISLAAIRTRASQAAAEAAAAATVQSEVDLELGMSAVGAESWQPVNRVRTSRDDSAANTPMKHQYNAHVASKAAAAARAFRDDSAGGMHVPSCKISTGGSYFSPVLSAQKALPQSRLKQQDLSIGLGLQPSLSDATKAALELSHLGLEDASQHNLAAAAGTAAGQQVPAYYVAMDYSASLGDGYSARYASKATAAATGKGIHPAGLPAAVYAGAAVSDVLVDAGNKTAHAELQQHQAAAPVKQHYSTAQLLNARQRSSSPGLKQLSAEPSGDSGYAVVEAPAAAVAAGMFLANTTAMPGDVVCCINQEPSAQLVAEQTVVEPVQLHEMLAEKAEGMLDQTQSVPYELSVSPSSRLYLSSSTEGKPAHQLMAPMNKDGATSASRANEGSGSMLTPVAGSPYLPDSKTSSPAVSSRNLNNSAISLHCEQLSSHGTSKLSMSSSTAPAASASPAGLQQASKALQQFADTQNAQVAAAIEHAEKAAKQAAVSAAMDGSLAMAVLMKPALAVPAAADEALSAAEMFALLFDPTMTPTDKARRMQDIFKKTMSKRNIPLNSLEQTIAAMMPSPATTETVSALAAAAASTDATSSIPVGIGASQQSALLETAVTLSIPAAVLPKSAVAAPAAVEPFHGENIQDLLAHMNEFEDVAHMSEFEDVAAASPTAAGTYSSCSSPSGRQTPGSAVVTPSPKVDAAASSNSSSGALQSPARLSYADVAMARTQSGSSSGGGFSSSGRATCPMTQ